MRQIFRILRFTSELRWYYVWIGIFTILLSVMSQLQPLFTKGAIDQITNQLHGGKADVALVAIFAVAVFLTDLGQTLLSNVAGHLGDMMAIKVRRLMSQRYYAHLMTLPQSYYDSELSGKIINRMNRGIDQISDFMQMYSNNFLQFLFSTIFSLVIVFYFSWPVGLMLLLLYPIFIGLTAKNSSTWQGFQKKINEEQDIATGRFTESIGQIKVVKSFIQEARELAFFKKRLDTVVNTTKPQSLFWHRQDVYRRLVLNFIFLAVYVYIFVATAERHYDLGTMVLLIQYATLIRIPIFSISFLIDQTQRAVANTKDYFEVMDVKSTITDQPNARKLRVNNGEVAFHAVTFAYDDTPVLKGLNFSLKPDSKVAIVGESGEGKTTVTNLLMRLYEPQAGEITIDDQNIADVTQASLRSQIGVVFQDPALFSGTIRENISYANPKASDKEIKAAARVANADKFIEKFDNGYETEIGERGLKLSGGQKQRIAIARALLKDAPILILDEATSSLDSRSEIQVQEALKVLMKGRTTLIIAHRLSTIQQVDQIITLKGGMVDEVGSPAELARTDGVYAQLLKLQQGHSDTARKKLKEYGIAG
ncbi:MAG TPA: ABC transporter ATP-binding protein [Candidatus Saccharimonadales bacterium]|nr:ABC transporter ATP-binding protein [Candidatus Saccharimonadales bacterium]